MEGENTSGKQGYKWYLKYLNLKEMIKAKTSSKGAMNRGNEGPKEERDEKYNRNHQIP